MGWHSAIGERGCVDVRVEPRGKSGVRRLLHWARDHQLEQAANTRKEIRSKAPSPVLPSGHPACSPSSTSLIALQKLSVPHTSHASGAPAAELGAQKTEKGKEVEG